MFTALRVRRPRHATVVAYLALFAALGGTSYAAVELKKGSVKSRHIAKNAITTKKVKNRTLRRDDFAKGQLPKATKGDPGPAGPAGPSGPQGPKGDAGAPATRLFAGFDNDGDLRFGSPGADAEHLANGDYQVTWGPQDLRKCAVAATIHGGAGSHGFIRRSVSPTANNKIRLITTADGGAASDRGFEVVVFC